ncbi:protoporphyrinogen oxidase [Serratia symbiotica str. 'Cinara cedri']|nr:protoporphyrinogen oxidase [Serratia symbiotica str. 'Cinara cedri']
MKLLILYSGYDGQTLSIATYIANKLQDIFSCEVINLLQAKSINLKQYHQVMIGASIRYGHFNSSLGKFVKYHAAQLNQMPSTFFAVNLAARDKKKCSPQTNVYTQKFLLTSPWHPKQCMVFAGALRYPRYNLFNRIMIQCIMRMTGGETDTSKEVEYTDWRQVEIFTQSFRKIKHIH